MLFFMKTTFQAEVEGYCQVRKLGIASRVFTEHAAEAKALPSSICTTRAQVSTTLSNCGANRVVDIPSETIVDFWRRGFARLHMSV